MPQLNILLQDFNEGRRPLNQKLILEKVDNENCGKEEMVTKYYDKISLDAPGYTPWFDVWTKLYIQAWNYVFVYVHSKYKRFLHASPPHQYLGNFGEEPN